MRPATVAVLAAMLERRLLGFRRRTPEWRTLPRDAGLRLFEQAFLPTPYRMIVVVPDFARFSARFRQTFAYLPLADFDRRGASAAERAFLRGCIERILPERAAAGEAAEVLQLDGSFCRRSEARRQHHVDGAVRRRRRVGPVSKRTSLAAIVPALGRGIGPDEGGIYTPHGGDGIFHLISM